MRRVSRPAKQGRPRPQAWPARDRCSAPPSLPAAVLQITANSAHRAPPGARLGRQRRRSVFVPLGLLDESGGPLPQTLVVVHRWAGLGAGRSQPGMS